MKLGKVMVWEWCDVDWCFFVCGVDWDMDIMLVVKYMGIEKIYGRIDLRNCLVNFELNIMLI